MGRLRHARGVAREDAHPQGIAGLVSPPPSKKNQRENPRKKKPPGPQQKSRHPPRSRIVPGVWWRHVIIARWEEIVMTSERSGSQLLVHVSDQGSDRAQRLGAVGL